ncbi:hypothetical protein TNCV_1891731 [Trichonephila clavipes]|nr:hypothetical protein TNCV_1891731 [Trichonephila clavipes]
MEGAVKSLRCSAAKHTVRNEKYVVDIVMVQQGSYFEAMDVSFNVQYHCSQDIREVRVVYGSTGLVVPRWAWKQRRDVLNKQWLVGLCRKIIQAGATKAH